MEHTDRDVTDSGNTDAGNTRPRPMVAIFDFDGTLVNTFVMSVRIFEKLTKRQQAFSDEEVQRLRGLNAFHLVRELRIPPWKLPWLLVRGRAMMRRQINDVGVFEGIETVLRQLQADGVPIYIMSSNSPGNIRKLLRLQGLEQYFLRVYGNVGVFSKAKVLRRVIARNKLNPSEVFYIGDEGRDIDAAKRVGLHSIAVAWGFNSPALLEHHRPYALVETPAGLGKLFAEIRNRKVGV
jgi:phosphoglycolate phosphatase